MSGPLATSHVTHVLAQSSSSKSDRLPGSDKYQHKASELPRGPNHGEIALVASIVGQPRPPSESGSDKNISVFHSDPITSETRTTSHSFNSPSAQLPKARPCDLYFSLRFYFLIFPISPVPL